MTVNWAMQGNKQLSRKIVRTAQLVDYVMCCRTLNSSKTTLVVITIDWI